MVTRFWWVRHGPVETEPGTIKGQTDVSCVLPQEAVRALRSALPKNALVVASPLARAVDTGRAVMERAPDFLEPALMEQDFGAWTGRTWADIESDPASAAFWRSPALTRAPGGESFADQVARVAAVVERLSADHAGRDIVCPCHAGTIRAAVAHALGITSDPTPALGFVIHPLSLTRIDVFDGGGARIMDVNAGGCR